MFVFLYWKYEAMYPESSEGLNKETKEAVYFFTTPFHPLDNFSAHTVRIWGKTFPTSEHAYQWKKYSSSYPKIAESILAAVSPHAVKQIADLHKPEVSPEWYEKRVVIMEEILQVKAEQHKDVRDALKRTGSRIIVENSPVDSFWGTGPDGTGENQMGEIWMKIRLKILVR